MSIQATPEEELDGMRGDLVHRFDLYPARRADPPHEAFTSQLRSGFKLVNRLMIATWLLQLVVRRSEEAQFGLSEGDGLPQLLGLWLQTRVS